LKTVNHNGFRVHYCSHPCVYEPEADTYLLADVLIKDTFENSVKPRSVLEIGVGTGYLLSLSIQMWGPDLVVGTDINPYAAKASLRVVEEENAVQPSIYLCDRDACIRDGVVFDVAYSNPPYLPVMDRFNDECSSLMARSWGCGEDCILLFCKSLCRRGRLVYMVASSVYPVERIIGCMENSGCEYSIIGREKFFFEEILVLKGEKKDCR
jgi:release factor glutamine methyltransferase